LGDRKRVKKFAPAICEASSLADLREHGYPGVFCGKIDKGESSVSTESGKSSK